MQMKTIFLQYFLEFRNCQLLYVFMYTIAPHVASFYENSMLSPVLKVLSLTLFAGAFNSIQNAYVSRNLLFKNYLRVA